MTTTVGQEKQPADVFVVFGITGDLAKVMTFRSLYRLEARGLLECPIVGVAVDDWDVDQLVQRARESIEGTGERLDPEVFNRFAGRLSYVSGDFTDATTYQRVGESIKGAACPVFYLEIPPFLFGKVVKGLAEAGLTKTARVVVESRLATTRRRRVSWPTSYTSTSMRTSCIGSITTSERWGWRRSSISGSPIRSLNRSGTAIT
jgi:glucose-6-phosphate 1-dehydrogenase